MKTKSMVLLLVAAGFGLVAMLGVMQVINGKAGKEPTVKVLVATADIPSGMPLEETNVTFKEFPQSAVPSGAVTTPEEYAGKCLITRAVPGEMIMSAKLGGAESITASHQIPVGMRVATVSVNATKSHSGLIRPTDRVDVVCSYEAYNAVTRTKQKRVKTVLEFIEVFAVDNVRAGREGEVEHAIKNVSLIVDPNQFQLLTAAGEMGELDLSLRNREDTDMTDVAELTDAVFFQKDISEGSRETPEKSASQPAATAQGGGLQDFLSSAMTAMAEVATLPTAAAETPMWTMTICRGESIEDVEVLDEAALPKNLTAAERQRVRAESRNPAPPAKAKDQEPTNHGPALFPSQPPVVAPPAQPAAAAPTAGPGPATQASATPAAPPALMPLLPIEQ